MGNTAGDVERALELARANRERSVLVECRPPAAGPKEMLPRWGSSSSARRSSTAGAARDDFSRLIYRDAAGAGVMAWPTLSMHIWRRASPEIG